MAPEVPVATISFDLSFMSGEHTGTEPACRSECPATNIWHSKFVPHRVCRHQRTAEFSFSPLSKQWPRTTISTVNSSLNSHQLLRCTPFLTATPVSICKDIHLYFLQVSEGYKFKQNHQPPGSRQYLVTLQAALLFDVRRSRIHLLQSFRLSQRRLTLPEAHMAERT